MAELLSQQYCSAFSDPDNITHDNIAPNYQQEYNENNPGSSSLIDISFDEEDIVQAIDELGLASAGGYGGFPSILLVFVDIM